MRQEGGGEQGVTVRGAARKGDLTAALIHNGELIFIPPRDAYKTHDENNDATSRRERARGERGESAGRGANFSSRISDEEEVAISLTSRHNRQSSEANCHGRFKSDFKYTLEMKLYCRYVMLALYK